MFTGLFAKLAWSEIKGPLLKAAPWIGGILALLLAWNLTAVHYREQGREDQRKNTEAVINQRDSWIAAFHQSDDNFKAAIAAVNIQNADARKLADAYDRSKAVDAQNVAASNARWDVTQKRLSALQGVIAKNGGCKVDPDVLNALGGL